MHADQQRIGLDQALVEVDLQELKRELAGRTEEARQNAKWALNLHPGYNLSVCQPGFPYKREDHRQRMVEAMGRAGIPA